jgi:high-affinity Fe2+/Pb2+ permease
MVFAPATWVPQRLPIWGAILGLIAGLLAIFILDLLSRISSQAVPLTLRGAAVVIVTVFYYFLWMLVRVAYRSLGRPNAVA